MQRLQILADKLLYVLLLLLSFFLAGMLGIIFYCKGGRCVVTDWLQVWVEFLGFISAIVTFLAAWLDANRRPNLKLYVSDVDDIDRSPAKLSCSLVRSQRENIKLLVRLENASPEPARFITIVADLQYPTDVPEAISSWIRLVNVIGAEPLGDFQAANPLSMVESFGQEITTLRSTIVGGDNIIIYGEAPSKPVLKYHIGLRGLVDLRNTHKLSTLREVGITELHYVIRFHVYSDKQTVKINIPLAFHLRPYDES